MGRRPRNRLPTARQLLIPKAYNSLNIKHELDRSKASQKFYHDKSRASKHHLPLTPGEEVRQQKIVPSSGCSETQCTKILHCGLWWQRVLPQQAASLQKLQISHFPSDEPWTEPAEAAASQEMPLSSNGNMSASPPEKPLDSDQAGNRR